MKEKIKYNFKNLSLDILNSTYYEYPKSDSPKNTIKVKKLQSTGVESEPLFKPISRIIEFY